MTTNQPPKEKNFSFNEFKNNCTNLFKFSSSQVNSYLNSPEVKQMFKQKLSVIFQPHEQDPVLQWTNAGIKTFKSDNMPLSDQVVETINVISKSTDISILKVYVYLDSLRRSNPFLKENLQKPARFVKNMSQIENSVIEIFHRERINYLNGIFHFVSAAVENRTQGEQSCSSFLDELMEENKFLDLIFDNYNDLHKSKPSEYMKRNIDYYTVGMLKEQCLILNILFKLYIGNRLKKGESFYFERFFKIFVEQNFSGMPSFLNESEGKTAKVDWYAKKLAADIGYLQLFLSLKMVFKNRSVFTEDSKDYNVFYKKVFNNIKTEIQNDSMLKNNTNISFFVNSLKIFGLLIAGRFNSSSALDVRSTISDFNPDSLILFPQNIHEVLKGIKNVDISLRNEYRHILKQVLEAFWYFSTVNQEEFFDVLFQTEDDKSDLFISLFGEITKNQDILTTFWENRNDNNSGMNKFVDSFLSKFPYRTNDLLRVVKCILGNNDCSFADILIKNLSQLNKITCQMKNMPKDPNPERVTDEFFETEFERYRLSKNITIEDNVIIPMGVDFIDLGKDVYEFQIEVNFWNYLIKNILKLLNQFTTEGNYDYRLAEYLDLLCRFVINSPNEIDLIEQGGSENEDQTEITKILFILFNSFSVFYNNEADLKIALLIIRAIKSLVLSSHGELTRFFILLHPELMEEQEGFYFFTNFLDFFDRVKNNVQQYKTFEKYFLKLFDEIIQLMGLVMADDNFIIMMVKSSLNPPSQPIINTNADMNQISQELIRLKQLVNVSITNNDWIENGYEIYDVLKTLFKKKHIMNSNMLQILIQKFIFPLCNKFITDEFDVKFDNIGLKYKIYKSLFDFLNVSYSKLINVKSRFVLFTDEFRDKLTKNIYDCLFDSLSKLPIRQLINEAFNVRIDSDKIKKRRIMNKKQTKGIENKHIVVNVYQKDNHKSEIEVKAFLSSSLRFLNTVLKMVTSLLENDTEQKESNLIKDLVMAFCVKDMMIKYTFNSFTEQNEVSLITALNSLLETNNVMAMSREEIDIDVNKCEWILVNNVFNEARELNTYLHQIDLYSIFSRCIRNDSIPKKNGSMSCLVFESLNQLVKLWKTQQKTTKPILKNYICGNYMELPNKNNLWHEFIINIHTAINIGSEKAIDFLLELCDSQFSVIEAIIKTEEQELDEKDNKNNGFFELLSNGLNTLNKVIKEGGNDKIDTESVLCKLMIFCIKLFRSNKINKTILERHWDLVVHNLINALFDYLERKPDSMVYLSNSVYDLIQEENDNSFRKLYENPHSVNAALGKLENLTKQEKLFDEVIVNMQALIQKQFVMEIQKDSSEKFKVKNEIFVNRLQKSLGKLIRCCYSDAFFQLGIMMKSLSYDGMPKLISTFNKISSNSFYNDTSERSFAKQKFDIDFKETNGNCDVIYNPMLNYYITLFLDYKETEAVDVFLNTFFANTVSSILLSKQRVQKSGVDLIKLFHSFGITGTLCGTTLSHFPFTKLQTYFETRKQLAKDSENENLKAYKDFLIRDFSCIVSSNSLLSSNPSAPNHGLLMNERLSILPFWNINQKYNNLIIQYRAGKMIVNEKTTYDDRLINMMITPLMNRFLEIQVIFQEYIGNLKIENDITNNVSVLSSHSLKNFFELLNSFLSVLNHVSINLLTILKGKDNTPLINSIKKVIDFCLEYFEIVSVSSFKRDPEIILIFKTIFLSLHCLKSLKSNCQEINVNQIMYFTFDMLKINQKDKSVLLKIIELLVDFSPNCNGVINIVHINYLSGRICDKEIEFEEFSCIVNLLLNINTREKTGNLIYNSKLITDILNIESVRKSNNFSKPLFYNDNKREETSARFCLVLQLFVSLMDRFFEQSDFVKDCFYFFNAYKPRIEMLLDLKDNQTLQESQKNTAYLDELSLVLSFLSILSDESEYWKSKNPASFSKVLFYLSNHILNILSHDTSNLSTNNKNDSAFISDRFKPVCSFDKLLASIPLLERSSNKPRGGDSVSRFKSRSNHKTSVVNEINRFTTYKNLVISYNSSRNLFQFSVENKAFSCLFHLFNTLIRMFDCVNFSDLLRNEGSLFKEETLRMVSNAINGCQLFLVNAHQRLIWNEETYLEGLLHFTITKNTIEAYRCTRGLSSGLSCLSLAETKQLVRKTFEMTFLLQMTIFKFNNETNLKNRHFYADMLSKSKEKSRLLLADFMRFIDKSVLTHSNVKKSKKFHTTPDSFKSVSKFTPRNFVSELPTVGEGREEGMLVNKKSIELHAKFLDQVNKYYNGSN